MAGRAPPRGPSHTVALDGNRRVQTESAPGRDGSGAVSPEPVICQRCWALLHPDHTAEHEAFCSKVQKLLPFEACGERLDVLREAMPCHLRKGHDGAHIFYVAGAFLDDPRRR